MAATVPGDHRGHHRRAPAQRGELVAQPEQRQARELADAGVAGEGPQAGQAVHRGQLRDHGRDAAVGDRRGDHVAAREGVAPQHDPLGVDAVERARVGDRGRVVL